MNYKQAFQYAGGRNGLSWKNGPPRQTRAADTVALGSVLSEPTLVLPRPGAPEVMLGDVYMREPRGGITRAGMNGLGGCGCKGSCGCTGMGAVQTSLYEDVSMTLFGGVLSTGQVLVMGGAAYLAYRLFFKKKR